MQRLDQQSIKRHNIGLVYERIRRSQGLSRAELSAALGLSKTTVSTLVDQLIQDGYVCHSGTKENGRIGRNGTGLALDAAQNAVAVIHWHRSQLELALVDPYGQVITWNLQKLDPQRDIVDELCAGYKSLGRLAGTRRMLGLMLIVPGIVDGESSNIYSTVLPIQDGSTLLERFHAALPDVSLGVFNDTACYAVAEENFGRVETGRYALVNINKGIGAALVMDGNILRGAGAMATQFGHYSIDPDGQPCSCGNRGCLEGLVGEMALPARAAACGVADSFALRGSISFLSVGQLAAAGNRGALRLADVLAKDLSYALGNLIALYNPELVILGGRSTQLGGHFLEILREKLDKQGFAYFVQRTQLRYSNLDDTAALQGAALYYLGHHYDFSEGASGRLILN